MRKKTGKISIILELDRFFFYVVFNPGFSEYMVEVFSSFFDLRDFVIMPKKVFVRIYKFGCLQFPGLKPFV